VVNEECSSCDDEVDHHSVPGVQVSDDSVEDHSAEEDEDEAGN